MKNIYNAGTLKLKKICYITTVSITIRSFFISQLQYLSKNGWEVTVICSEDNELKDLLGQKIKYIPVNITRGISFFSMIKSIIELIKVFKKERFDIVQYSTPNAAFCAAIASKLARVKIRNYHLMGFRYLGFSGINRNIFKIIEKFTCSLSTDIECITKSNLEFVLGVISDCIKYSDKKFIIGIGNNNTRKFIAEKYSQLDYYTAIHPTAVIAENVKIGKGTAVMANAGINTSSIIGEHCIINTSAVVEHDNMIGDYAHISPGAVLCGTVKVGNLTHIGANSTVRNNISICGDCIIGCGGVVVKDIDKPNIYTGVPAIELI